MAIIASHCIAYARDYYTVPQRLVSQGGKGGDAVYLSMHQGADEYVGERGRAGGARGRKEGRRERETPLLRAMKPTLNLGYVPEGGVWQGILPIK